MELRWNGTDITGKVNITGCVHRDVAGGKSDTLELQMDRSDIWYRWGPEEGDRIQVTEGGYDSGEMYLTAVVPVRDQFRVLAAGIKPEAARKKWEGFRNVSFHALVERCAAECGMEGKVYGMEKNLMIPYALRKGEGVAAFLDRIATAEGFKLKAWGGALRAIYLPYAEEMEAANGMKITSMTSGVLYRRRKNAKYTMLTVQSPFATATARDTAAEGNFTRTLTGLPAEDGIQAGRWARNLLRHHNRQAEEMTVEQSLNTKLTALTKVSVNGGTDMDGEWIIEEAEHDLKNKTSSVKMYRVIETVR